MSDLEQQFEDLVIAADEARSLRTADRPWSDAEIASLQQQCGLATEIIANYVRSMRAFDVALGEDPADSEPVPTLPGDYELRGELGRGGMGVVYRVFQRSLEREVALKLLRPGERMFGTALQRFHHEARSLARLRHPHIVSVHEVGETAGHVYFTMDLVEGRTLAEVIRDGGMTIARTVRLLRQVCSAVAYAHGQGVVHRDLKPANILVAARAENSLDAFVVDFGLARDAGAAAAYTVSGQLLGTPGYMSPEQALGDTAKVNEQSDIYALGVVLYESLTGAAPFAGMPLARVLRAVVEAEPEPLRNRNAAIPRDLEVLCRKAMAKRPEDRFATVAAFDAELARFAAGQPILTQPPGWWRRLAPALKRYGKWTAAAALLVLLAVLLTIWWIAPGIWRESNIAQARDLLAEGNTRAAWLAFERAYEGLDQQDRRPAVDYDYACALHREAAAAILGESKRSASEAPALLARARELLRAHVPQQSLTFPGRFSWSIPNVAGDLSIDVLAQIELFCIDAWSAESLSADDQTHPAWMHGATGQRRWTTLPMLLRCRNLRNLWQATPNLAHRVLLDGLRKVDRLPPRVRDEFTDWCCGQPWFYPLVSVTNTRFERELVELIRTGDERTATLAAAILEQVGPVRLSPTVGTPPEAKLLIPKRDRLRLASTWERLQGMTVLDAHREAVRLTAVQRFTVAATTPEKNRFRLGLFLYNRTAANASRRSYWESFWQKHGEEDPRLWLLRWLEWDVSPADLTPDSVLQRWRKDDSGRAQHFHSLMLLVTKKSADRPVAANPEAWAALLR